MNTRRITKVIIASVVIGSAVGYLLYEVIDSSWVYYYSVDEFVDSQPVKTSQKASSQAPKTADNRIIRLAGWVKKDSILRDTEKMQVDFELAGQKNAIPVRFYGIVPNNFAADREVLVEGKAGTDGVFTASRILTRCESKYKARLKTDE